VSEHDIFLHWQSWVALPKHLLALMGIFLSSNTDETGINQNNRKPTSGRGQFFWHWQSWAALPKHLLALMGIFFASNTTQTGITLKQYKQPASDRARYFWHCHSPGWHCRGTYWH
jgi:hypothetical protein